MILKEIIDAFPGQLIFAFSEEFKNIYTML